MNYNDAINWITVNIFQNETLISSSIGALVGAVSAYQLNRQKEKRKEELIGFFQ